MEQMNIVACHRLEKTGRVVKLLNRKDAQNVLKEKHKLRSINLYDDNTDTNNKRKIFINQRLCPYHRKLYGMMKDLNNEGLIDCFWITNRTIKIRESGQSKPISITHESDLQFWRIKKLDIDMSRVTSTELSAGGTLLYISKRLSYQLRNDLRFHDPGKK